MPGSFLSNSILIGDLRVREKCFDKTFCNLNIKFILSQ